jgi:hypothetical protein
VNGVDLLLGQALVTMKGGRNPLIDHPKALEERYITLVDLMGQVRDKIWLLQVHSSLLYQSVARTSPDHQGGW